MKTIKDIELAFQEGTSDKIYNAQIIQNDDGCVVNFQFGRRGGSLKEGTKTPQPVELNQAIEIFTDLVASKTKKGYQVV